MKKILGFLIIIWSVWLLEACECNQAEDTMLMEETENVECVNEKVENETQMEIGAENEYEKDTSYEIHKIYVSKDSSDMQELTADSYFPDDVTTIPVLQFTFPDDSEKEDRINKMMIERSCKTLPMEQDWLDTTEIQITYRSERYLCFEYISKARISSEFDFTKLNFTLDLQQEQWVEYPMKEEDYFFFEDTDLYKEMENYVKMPVEEQSLLRGETAYELYEQEMEEENITFSVIQVKGMLDEIKQEQINRLLKEPMITLMEDDQWTEDKEGKRKEILDGTLSYIAYKTENWLSILYIIPHGTGRYYFQKADIEMGVTINMQTGERYMLDDLFKLFYLNEWMSVNGFDCIDYPGGCVLDERGLAEKRKEDEFYEGDDIITRLTFPDQSWLSFYLYNGRIVFVRCDGNDYTIELPDIYEYLKVDPWY